MLRAVAGVAGGVVRRRVGWRSAAAVVRSARRGGTSVWQRGQANGRRWNSTAGKESTEAAGAEGEGAASEAAAGAGSAAMRGPGKGRGPVTWLGLTALVVGGAGAVGYFKYQKSKQETQVAGKVTSYGKPALGGPFELVNQDGVPVTDASYQGEYLLLYFGFTYCPDICPSELVKMGKVVSMLDGKSNLPKVRPVFISLDPNRDTVAQMKAYIQDFHPRMEALTGTPEQIGRAAKHYRVYFTDVDREEDDDDYVVDHSIIMYFVAPNGDFLEFFTQLAEPEEIVDKMSFHLRNMTGSS